MKSLKRLIKVLILFLMIFSLCGFSNDNLYSKALQEQTIPKHSLDQSKNAINNSNSLKVAFYGDSITEGADQTNPEDAYAKRVESMIRDSLPSVNVTIGNFGLGGRNLVMAVDPNYVGLSQPETSTTQGFNRPWSVVGKSWINHVRDFQPDVIVLAFGMNDASQVGTDNVFAQYLETFNTIIHTWTKVPSIIVVPVFPPTKDYSRFGGTADSQMITQAIGRATREYAKSRGWVIADVNRLYNILLNGFDDVTRYSVNEGFENYGAWFGDTSSFTLNTGTLTPNAGTVGKSIARSVNFYNGSIQFTLNPSAEMWNGMVYVQYRSAGNFGSMSVYVFPGMNGFFQIITDGQVQYTSPTISIPINTNTKFQVIASGSHHKVYINDLLITDFVSYKKMNDGGIILGSVGKLPTISNFTISTLTPVTESPQFTEDQLIGPFNSPLSGNGINHPSGLGHSLFYAPAFQSVVQELAR